MKCLAREIVFKSKDFEIWLENATTGERIAGPWPLPQIDAENMARYERAMRHLQNEKVMAALDWYIVSFTQEQRDTFNKLRELANPNLDAWAFVGVCGMIRHGLSYRQCLKYVGAAVNRGEVGPGKPEGGKT